MEKIKKIKKKIVPRKSNTSTSYGIDVVYTVGDIVKNTKLTKIRMK